jgi:hypothetical protein
MLRTLDRIIHVTTVCGLLLCCEAGQAQGTGPVQDDVAAARSDPEAIAYKLTTALYHTSTQPNAFDVNLRATFDVHTAWVGFYRRASEFEQARVGYENNIALPFGRLTPSVQYASGGFLGGSLTAEIGEPHFGLLGIGRTNLKEYFNLNFDPNDSILIGAGTRALPNTVLSLYQIRDDRLGTGQRVVHLSARVKPDARTRWTVEVFYKEGRASAEDEVKVRGTGVSVTYDYERYFVKVTNDPHVNFTPDRMLRVSAGIRF